MFSLVSLSKSKFFTLIGLVSFVQHSCRIRFVCVALVSHLSVHETEKKKLLIRNLKSMDFFDG